MLDVDIRIERGRFARDFQFSAASGILGITGPSGSGKTSLLNAVAGIVSPVRGHIRFGERRYFESDRAINLPPEARRCGYVFQDGRLFPHMSVLANLRYGKRQQSEPLISETELVNILGIAPLLDRRPHTLSGGEAQRVAIGRALLSSPDVLLLDEPLASLDADRRDGIMTALEAIRDKFQGPVLYVSHDQQEISRLSDNILDLH